MGRPPRKQKDGKFFCGLCEQFLPPDSFYRSGSAKDGRKWECKTCASEDQKRRLREDRARKKTLAENMRKWRASESGQAFLERTKDAPWRKAREAKALRSRLLPYKITVDRFYELLELQNWCCACCYAPFPSTTEANVDHCHQQGYVRGLLCGGCNKAIGLVKDDAMRCLALAAYIAESHLRPAPEDRRFFDLHERLMHSLCEGMAEDECDRPDRVVRAEHAERRTKSAEMESRS